MCSLSADGEFPERYDLITGEGNAAQQDEKRAMLTRGEVPVEGLAGR
jgi:hypothetical protein